MIPSHRSTILLLLLLLLILPIHSAKGTLVVRVDVKGEINEGTAILIDHAFKKAEELHANAILIVLDTPGGLLSATKHIVKDILNSEIPVITYVYPRGAFSASAGTLILISGNLAGMANGTSIGAMTPYTPGFPPKVENKTINYIASYAMSIAEMRHRPADVVRKFVTQGLSLTAREAYEKGVVDILADTPRVLFEKLNGRIVEIDGHKVRLNFEDVKVVKVGKPLEARLYSILTNPIVTSLLLIIGIYCLIFGLMTPGLGMETFGLICLILALLGLGAINISTFALLLVLLGIILLILEIFRPTMGILGILSIVCIALGILTLFREPLMPKEFYKEFLIFVEGTSLGIAVIMTFVIVRVAHVRKMRVKVGGEAIIGEVGIVLEFKDGKGKVKVRGEIWNCKSDKELKKGDEVVVVGRDGLTLFVSKRE